MCAADMCEGVLAHARGSFSTTVHVLSAPSTHHGSTTAVGGKGCGNGNAAAANLMVVGDSKLACAAREARALHGMLMTIHEVRCPLLLLQICILLLSRFSLLLVGTLLGTHRIRKTIAFAIEMIVAILLSSPPIA